MKVKELVEGDPKFSDSKEIRSTLFETYELLLDVHFFGLLKLLHRTGNSLEEHSLRVLFLRTKERSFGWK